MTTTDIESIEISEDVLPFIKPDLQPGEQLLWAARPGSRFLRSERGSTGAKVGWIFFLILQTGGCLIVFRATNDHGIDKLNTGAAVFGFFSAVVAVFLAVNLAVGLISSRNRATRVYALTDRRAMIWVPVKKSAAVKVHTFPQGSIKAEDLHRVQYPDGSGDLLFRNEFVQPDGFRDVANVRRVEDLVRRFLIDIPTDS